MPVFRDRASRTDLFTLWDDESIQAQFSRAISDNSIDTIGNSGRPANYEPVESAWYIPGPTALVDTYTPNAMTSGTLVVDDPNHVMAACDIPGDNDWFAVTLTGGVTYQFGQYARAGSVSGTENSLVPLADAYLEIRDSAGNLLAIADGGGPNTPSGLDALMTFEAPSSGTYYVNATSYDNTGDGVGDFAGNYEIFAITATAGTVYTTPYDISSPLHSIDWGGVMVNREHVSVRNPDGMEGPRPTGQLAADPATVEGNDLGFPGKNVIYLYFAGQGDLYANADATIPAQVTAQDPYQYEIQAMLTAANEFSKVADVVFVSNYNFNVATGLYERDETIKYKPGPTGLPEEGIQYATGVDDAFDADFFYWSYPGTPGPGISLLGSMNPPDYGDEGTAQFNSADERWNAQMLQPGGFSFVTLIHEFGHGMGLAHPHDTGGGSSIMQGVAPGPVPGDDGGAGAFDLNQGVNTMMSYNDGWEKSPYGQEETTNEGFGWLGSLMALDIAVIQDKYGVNEDWATGNDTYVLKDVNEWGVYIDSATGQPAEHNATNQATTRDGYYVGQSTFYSSIWDANGNDSIVYVGARNANIDLRAATLQYESGGAGWMSYAFGIYGGFTIANGVTIENGFGGSGNDALNGNHVANRLEGGAGRDGIAGGGGDDFIVGGADGDWLFGEAGGDTMIGEGGDDRIEGGAGRDGVLGGAGVDYIAGGADGDWLFGEDGIDTILGGEGDDHIEAGAGQDGVLGGAGADFMLGGADGDWLFGEAGVDTLLGEDGADYVDGGTGNDGLVGGGGADAFAFTTALGASNVDYIADFATGTDIIALDDAVFTGLSPGGLNPNAFVTGAAAQDADDRIIYNSATGALLFDADGNGAGLAVQFATLQAGAVLVVSDFTII
ncbi:MAG TPA: M10 family metallopeptidase C-terminal domain-containing protein [Allosphingosinicella sp.]|nr:M10 family metallopeptidase C-terminal domain-containing protein [Allosphingosinicella sp.]